MARMLFCQLGPVAYQISACKCRMVRQVQDLFGSDKFAKVRSTQPLPFLVCKHASLIRRTLGNVELELQENKAINLGLAAPKVNGILIRPGESFSFWHLVGSCTRKKGYRDGLTIAGGKPQKGMGGGMCQFTNLIHWMVLHSELTITEHHHHDQYDLFPDCGRQIPFGTGTSILYNYMDYRVRNDTDAVWQLLVHTDNTHLYGQLRCDKEPRVKYHVHIENEYFSKEGEDVFRNGTVVRECIDKATGNLLSSAVIKRNHAKVLYDTSHLELKEDTAEFV